MDEIQPAEEELASYFIEKSEKELPRKIDTRNQYLDKCLEGSLAIVDSWMDNLPAPVRNLLKAHHSSKNTLKSYRSDLIVFYEWCLINHKCPLPCSPLDLSHFLADQDLDGFKLATIKRRASSISWYHQRAGFLGSNNPRESAFVKQTMIDLARKNKGVPQDKAKELTTGLIREMVTLCKEDKNNMKGARDRALLLVGFASALRRENLAKIKVEHINLVIQGMEIYIPFSKTDQTGRGHVVRIALGEVPATCPVRAITDWLRLADISDGYVFRSVNKGGHVGSDHITPKTISRTVKSMLEKLERLDADEFSAHSLRSGFASTAAENGASIQSIKTQGAWKTDGSLMRYIRNKEDWDAAASYRLGL